MNEERFPRGFGAALGQQSWTSLADGLREKLYVSAGRRFRLLEFSEEFVEPEWCQRSHWGYVLEGEIVVDVDGGPIRYQAGDVVELPAGVPHRLVETVARATLFLMEEDS